MVCRYVSEIDEEFFSQSGVRALSRGYAKDLSQPMATVQQLSLFRFLRAVWSFCLFAPFVLPCLTLYPSFCAPDARGCAAAPPLVLLRLTVSHTLNPAPPGGAYARALRRARVPRNTTRKTERRKHDVSRTEAQTGAWPGSTWCRERSWGAAAGPDAHDTTQHHAPCLQRTS